MRAFLKSPLFVTLAIVSLGVFTQSLQFFEHVYWNVWFKNRAHIEQTDAVVVSLDNGLPISSSSVASSGGKQAELLDRLAGMGARTVFIDYPQSSGEHDLGEEALKAALKRNSTRTIVVRRSSVKSGLNRSEPEEVSFKLPEGVREAVSAWNVNFIGYAVDTRRAMTVDKVWVPSVASTQDRGESQGDLIFPEFSLRLDSIPIVDARSVLQGRMPADAFSGKLVFVTMTNPQLDSALGYYGHGAQKVPAALVDYSGIRGSARGDANVLGWVPLLLAFAATIIAGSKARRRSVKLFVYLAGTAMVLVVPGIIREFGYFLTVGPSLVAMLIYAPLRSSQKWRSRVQMTSSASGLPNITAMAAEGVDRTFDVIAVSVSQYEQMLASLPRELHGECARQIARRIGLGSGDRQVYDNDNGHFVWLENSKTLDGLIEHLEGLRALFSSPLVIGGHVLDTTVHFGVDRNIDSKPMSRIQSALASANEAQSKGKLYEEFGEQRLAQSPWELSLHARIDEGLRNGDIWLALQPQYDFRHNRISGAEALIRWTDPERGVIPPDAFILQAERAGRIEAITYWVLERSIRMLDQLNAVAAPFQISVNLSARMVDHPGLVHRIADIVRETGLKDCSRITFEVTETFSMANRDQAKINLAALRTMGFRLSIDDFGTGQASLAYLAEIPSDEIKLDRRFIRSITLDHRDQLIVESVIGLAHSLGQEVVAEGIEDIVTLEALRKLGCDLAQGYHIGRPMKLPELLELVDLSQAGTAGGAQANV